MTLLPDQPPGSLLEKDVVAILLPDAISILQNDFQLSGIELIVPEEFSKDVFLLKVFLRNAVEATGGPGNETLYRMLYRVDIQEEKIRNALNSSPTEDISSVISEMIIIRALQKSYYRMKYREGT